MKAFNDRAFLERMMFVPYDCKRNNSYHRFLSHMLIHADWGHLIFNMLSLYFLGSALLSRVVDFEFVNGEFEPIYDGLIPEFGNIQGQIHFITLYVLGGLFGTLWPFARNQDNPGYRSLGASGAVSAVIFACVIWMPDMRLNPMFIPIGIPAYILGPLYLAYEFYAHKRGGTGIAHDAHIGGAVFGIVYALIINIDKGKAFLDYFF